MPFGPFADFDECMSKMLEQYDEEAAANVCGAMKRDLGGGSQFLLKKASPEEIEKLSESKKVLSFEDNGRLFLKIFLLDGSVNLNDWGVAPESIPSNIQSAIGKPLVMYRNLGVEHDAQITGRVPGEFDHPPLSEQDLGHALAFQDLFRIGTFIDVFESSITAEKNKWYGVAEITDENVKRALREDPNVPFYVSPTIRLTEPAQPNQAVSHWQFMHSAIVDRPAYGVNKAYISGQCSGDKPTCLLQLRKASISQKGYGCGFCTYEAMKSILKKKEAQRYSGPNDADRPDSHFAYVPEEAKGADGSKSLRKFPIFDAPHVRNALARFTQADLPRNKRGEVLDNICRAAKKFDIDSQLCEERADSGTIPSSLSSSSTTSSGANSAVTVSSLVSFEDKNQISNKKLSTISGVKTKRAQDEEDDGLTEAETNRVEDLAEEIAELVDDIQELTASNNTNTTIANNNNGKDAVLAEKRQRLQKLVEAVKHSQQLQEKTAKLDVKAIASAVKKKIAAKTKAKKNNNNNNNNKVKSKKAQEDDGNNGGLTEAETDRVDDLVDQILEEVQDLVEDAGETPAEGGALGELEGDVEETAENIEDLVEDIKALTAAKKNLESQLQKANLEKAQFNARISRLEQDVEERDRQARLNAITNIVSGSVMYQGLTPEEIQKQIDTFMDTGWSVEQIQQHIEPLEANFRRASGNGAAGYKTASIAPTVAATTRLPLGNKAVETRSASVQNNNNNNNSTTTNEGTGNELPSFMRLATETFGRRYNSHSTSNAGGVQ